MKNIWTIVGTVAMVLLVVFLCIASFGMLGFARMGAPGMMGSRFGGYGMMGGFGMFGWIIPLLVLAIVVVGIVLFIIWFVNRNFKQPTMDTSVAAPVTTATGSLLDTLKMRYAKGEITKEQFDSMKHDLGIAES